MELNEALDTLKDAKLVVEGCCGGDCKGKKDDKKKKAKKKEPKEVEEALAILQDAGLIAESYWSGSRPNTKYGNRTGVAGYTFRGANLNRKYIKILICLRDGEKTKAEVHKALGMPDPTSETHKNYYTSVWQEMRKAGLVDFEKEGNKVIWFLTPRGFDLLDEIGATEKTPEVTSESVNTEAEGLIEAKKSDEKIKTINDVLKWLIAQGVVQPGECKKSDAEALWIPPAFEGDGAMTIRIFPDEDRLTITHANAGKFATRSLSYEALDNAWNKMTAAAY